MYDPKNVKSPKSGFKSNNIHPSHAIQETGHNYGYDFALNYIHIKVNLPKTCDPRS